MPAQHTCEAPSADSTGGRTARPGQPGAAIPAHAPGAPRPVSERKLQANRANAARSTGPRTDAGKAASARNALRHGLTAQTAVLAGEREHELRELARQLRAGLGPAHGAEVVLVERIVAVEWKLRRLASAEHAAAELEERQNLYNWERACKDEREWPGLAPPAGPRPGPRDAGEILAVQFFRKPDNAPLLRMADHEARLTATLLHAVRDLQRLRRARDAEDRPAEAEQEPDVPPTPPTPPTEADAPSVTIVEKALTAAPEPPVPAGAGSATEAIAVAPLARDEPTAPPAQNEPTAPPTGARPTAFVTSASISASGSPPSAQPGWNRSADPENEPTAPQRNGPVASPHQGPPAPGP